MKVQVDNRVVTMVRVSREVASSMQVVYHELKVVYHELNEHGQPVTEHSFSRDFFNDDGSFWTNGHHYRTGNMVGVKCELPECDRCPKHT